MPSSTDPTAKQTNALDELVVELFPDVSSLRSFLLRLDAGPEIEANIAEKVDRTSYAQEVRIAFQKRGALVELFWGLRREFPREYRVDAVWRMWAANVGPPPQREARPSQPLGWRNWAAAAVVTLAATPLPSRELPCFAGEPPEGSADIAVVLLHAHEDLPGVDDSTERRRAFLGELLGRVVQDHPRAVMLDMTFRKPRTAEDPPDDTLEPIRRALRCAFVMELPVFAALGGAPAIPWCGDGDETACSTAGLKTSPPTGSSRAIEAWPYCMDNRPTLPWMVGVLAAGLSPSDSQVWKGCGRPNVAAPNPIGALCERPYRVHWASDVVVGGSFEGPHPVGGRPVEACEPEQLSFRDQVVIIGDPRADHRSRTPKDVMQLGPGADAPMLTSAEGFAILGDAFRNELEAP